MPYSQPALRSSPPSYSHHSRSVSPHSPQSQNQNQNQNPSHSVGRVGHRRSYSSHAHLEVGSSSSSPSASTRFSPDSWSPGGNTGAWSGLGALPRRHSSAGTTGSKFHIGDRRGSSGSSDEDDDAHDPRLPPLKLKVQVLPSFSEGVPFPKSSTSSPVQAGPSPVPANVTMTRPTVTRTASSPAAPKDDVNSSPVTPGVILLSSGKPLRSSLKGSRASSLLNSPAGSPLSTSPANSSPVNSTTHSQVGSPMTSPSIEGMPASSFGSFGVTHEPDHHSYLAPPGILASALFSGHVRAQSAPSPPSTSSAYPSPAPSPLGPLSPSVSESDLALLPMSPGGSTILSPRNVHFPSLPSDLEHVKVFRKDGRPNSLLVTRKERDTAVNSVNRSLNDLTNGAGTGGEGEGTEGSGNGGEETETETETDREYGYGYGYNNSWGPGAWGGRNLWGAAATSSRTTGSPLGRVVPAVKTQPNSALANGSFPFPRLPRLARNRSRSLDQSGNDSRSGSSSDSETRIGNFRDKDGQQKVNLRVELDMSPSAYPVPRPDSVRDALLGASGSNLFLEEIRLLDSSESSSPTNPAKVDPESKLLVLEGTFLVRNITFEKHVFARFTTDNWATVNEVRAKWVGSVGSSYLTSLLRGVGSESAPRIQTLGDIVAIPFTDNDNENEDKKEWDRFSFRITLPPAVAMSPGRVVEFVGRFSTSDPGSEWWDNCGGKNWRVGFRTREVKVVEASPGPDALLLKVSPPRTLASESSSPLAPVAPSTTEVEDAEVVAKTSGAESRSQDQSQDVRSYDTPLTPPDVDVSHDQANDEVSKSDSTESLLTHPTPAPIAEDHVKADQANERAVDFKDTVKGHKERERAPKPTGLGSLSGLGGLFWPWKGPSTSAVQPRSAFSDSSSSGSGSGSGSLDFPSEAPSVSDPSTTSSSSPSPTSGSGTGSPGKKLAASATVEILSVIPSPSSRRTPPVSPTAISPPLKFQFERERIPSISSISSNSSVESMDSMLDVPTLERSASTSSVSTDGDGELVEPAPLSHSTVAVNLTPELPVGFGDYGLEMPTEMDNELTPVQDAWPGYDTDPQKGFFESIPGGVNANLKPSNADPLYNAFIQQWCFAGAGSR